MPCSTSTASELGGVRCALPAMTTSCRRTISTVPLPLAFALSDRSTETSMLRRRADSRSPSRDLTPGGDLVMHDAERQGGARNPCRCSAAHVGDRHAPAVLAGMAGPANRSRREAGARSCSSETCSPQCQNRRSRRMTDVPDDRRRGAWPTSRASESAGRTFVRSNRRVLARRRARAAGDRPDAARAAAMVRRLACHRRRAVVTVPAVSTSMNARSAGEIWRRLG